MIARRLPLPASQPYTLLRVLATLGLSFDLHGFTMTDANPGSEAPPKKKSLFKKSAWQRKQEQAQAGGEAERDMFSHSNDFKDIVAEETKRKLEERRKLEEARKHKADQERERKRRKVSTELDEPKLPSASGSSAHASRVGNKGYDISLLSAYRKIRLTRPQTQQDTALAHSQTAAAHGHTLHPLRFPHEILEQRFDTPESVEHNRPWGHG